jgi:hypothetical protein
MSLETGMSTGGDGLKLECPRVVMDSGVPGFRGLNYVHWC